MPKIAIMIGTHSQTMAIAAPAIIDALGTKPIRRRVGEEAVSAVTGLTSSIHEYDHTINVRTAAVSQHGVCRTILGGLTPARPRVACRAPRLRSSLRRKVGSDVDVVRSHRGGFGV